MTAQDVPAQPVTKVVQITNIAPQATKDQMQTLFGFLGKIEDIRLYPTIRDVSVPVQSRICYVKFFDSVCVGVAQHMTNTVFIDRALIVTPFHSTTNEIPDEYRALEIAAQANIVPGLIGSNYKLPAHVTNQIEGTPPNQVITTHDPSLAANGLPPYPPLPITYDSVRIEEIRRTILASNFDPSMTTQQVIEFFGTAGDVKYVRFCIRQADSAKLALVEYSEQSSIINALKMNGADFHGCPVEIVHSTMNIEKPQAKSNEAAQREIEEAMTMDMRVKEAQNLISATIDPVIGILSKDKKRGRSRSKSRRSRSRSRDRRRRRRSRSRSRKRRSRSKKRSRSRSRRRSRSRDRRRRSRNRRRSRSRSRSRSKGRVRRTRSRSRGRERRSRDEKEEKKSPIPKEKVEAGSSSGEQESLKDEPRKRSKSPSLARGRTKSRSRSVSRRRTPRRRSRSRSRRSHSRSSRRSPRKRSPRRKRSRSPKWRSSRSRSTSRRRSKSMS